MALFFHACRASPSFDVLAQISLAAAPAARIMAIRDNPIAARSMGINVSLYKSLTFGVSALYTGVAGALGAIVIQFVAPDSFTFVPLDRVCSSAS